MSRSRHGRREASTKRARLRSTKTTMLRTSSRGRRRSKTPKRRSERVSFKSPVASAAAMPDSNSASPQQIGLESFIASLLPLLATVTFLLHLVVKKIRSSSIFGDMFSDSTKRACAVVAASAAVGAVVSYAMMSSAKKKEEEEKEGLEASIEELKKSVATLRERQSTYSHVEKELEERWNSLPERIILLRHGESEGNVDHKIYTVKSDCQLELTKRGIAQATEAGKRIKEVVGDSPIVAFVSPFERAIETLLCVERSLDPHQLVEVHSDPRIREAERNNLQIPATEEERKAFERKREEYMAAKKTWEEVVARDGAEKAGPHPEYPKYKEGTIEYHTDMAERLGRFFYRRPNGESCADVYDRCGDFFNSLLDEGHHNMCHKFSPEVSKCLWNKTGKYTALIVTHGLTMRLFLMRYFSMSVDTFQSIWNARNCRHWTLKKNEKKRRYELCAEESFPKRLPWATREVVVELVTPDGKREYKEVTVVDYLSIRQPRSSHPEDAVKLMVSGHNIPHIGRKYLDRDSRTLKEDGRADIPLLEIEPKNVDSIDWWASSNRAAFPPCNALSEQARSLRTNLKVFRQNLRRRATDKELPVRPPMLSALPSMAIGGRSSK